MPSASRKRGSLDAGLPVKKPKSDPMIGAILEAIDMADDLPSTCKGMLSAMVPEAFQVPAADRHPHQQVFVDIVGQVISKIDEEMKKNVADAGVQLEEMEKQQERLKVNVEAAQTVHTEKKLTVEERKASLAEHFRQVLDKRMELASAKEARAAIEAPIAEVTAQKNTCETALQDLSALRELADLEQAKPMCMKLLEVALQMGIEEALVMSLPNVFEKAPADRTNFDSLVLGSIETEFQKKTSEFAAALSTKAESIQQLDAAVQAAQTALDAITAEHQVASDSMAQVVKEEKASLEMLEEQKQMRDTFLVEFQEKHGSVTEKKEHLQNFQAWNVDCYKTLKDKQVPVEP
jgi:DNA repair exonuclease SbcCD ATPase subunit